MWLVWFFYQIYDFVGVVEFGYVIVFWVIDLVVEYCCVVLLFVGVVQYLLQVVIVENVVVQYQVVWFVVDEVVVDQVCLCQFVWVWLYGVFDVYVLL